MKKTTSLYHYCSLDSLFKIILSKKLWLSSSNVMNDSFEGKWAYHVLLEMSKIDEQYGEVDESEIKMKENLQKLYNYSEFSRDMHIFYFLSLSEERDLLSQWRGYASDGSGVAIGFKVGDVSSDRSALDYSSSVKQRTKLQKMEYKSFTEVSSFLLDKYHQIPEVENDRVDCHFRFHKDIEAYNAVTKNIAFSEEKEWRFVTRNSNVNVFDNSHNPDYEAPLFRTNGYKLISYYEYDFLELFNNQNPINEIILGPKCEIDETELKLFLSVNNFNSVYITRSSASYR